jgi:predicted ATPase
MWSNVERVEVAKYNLLAGKKSMSMSGFSVAFDYFDHGMTFLPKDHWREHYSLTLELYELAIKCSQIISDTTSLTILTDQVMKQTNCLEDKLNTLFINMAALSYASKIAESAEKGFIILGQLGINVPNTVAEQNSRYSIEQILVVLKDVSDDDIINYRWMSDTKTIMMMKFLAKLEATIIQVRPEVQPFITVNMLWLTISHGLCSVSPIAFAYFASLVARIGDLANARRFTYLAKSLLKNKQFKEVSGEVIAIATGVQYFLEPMQAVIPFFLEGEAAAMCSGDINLACMNR